MGTTVIHLRENSPTYERILYPNGAMQVRIRPEAVRSVEHDVTVVARLGSARDIIELALLKDALDSIHLQGYAGEHSTLVVPCGPYDRADRRFVHGDCNGLDVYGSLVNTMRFAAVVSLDAHSPNIAADEINRFTNVSPKPFIEQAIQEFGQATDADRLTVLFPDKGASKRYQSMLPAMLGCNIKAFGLDFVFCDKIRDGKTGELLGFEVPDLPKQPTIIVDDLCDGGGTFLGIAKAIAGAVPLGLYVTHGIFSKGLDELATAFLRIFTTDSIEQNQHPSLTVFQCLAELLKTC